MQFLSRYDFGKERIDSSHRYHQVHAQFAFFVLLRPWGFFIFVSKYHNAPRSVFDAIHAKEYAAEDTVRKIGKRRKGYRSSSSDISLRLPEILLFILSPRRRH